MSYTKHNFATGEVLYASQLRDMDDAIYTLDGKVTTIEGQTSGLSNLSTLSSNFNSTIYVGQDKTAGSQNADLFLNPGSYVVNLACLNTPYKDSRFYDWTGADSPYAYGHIFVFGLRPDRINANNCLICQIFVEGNRTLTNDEALQEDLAQTSEPSYSYPIGRIYTRYYSGSTWSNWMGYVESGEYDRTIRSIKSRLDALEGNADEETQKDNEE